MEKSVDICHIISICKNAKEDNIHNHTSVK